MQAYAPQNPPAKEPLERYNVKNENNGVLNTFYEENINKSSRVYSEYGSYQIRISNPISNF